MIRDLVRECGEFFRVTWEHLSSPTLTTRTERYLWSSGWAVSGFVALVFGLWAWVVVTILTLVGWTAGYIYGDRQQRRAVRSHLGTMDGAMDLDEFIEELVDEEGIEPSRDEPTGA